MHIHVQVMRPSINASLNNGLAKLRVRANGRDQDLCLRRQGSQFRVLYFNNLDNCSALSAFDTLNIPKQGRIPG